MPIQEPKAKAVRLPGSRDTMDVLLCPREAIRNLPAGVRGCTATDMFSRSQGPSEVLWTGRLGCG